MSRIPASIAVLTPPVVGGYEMELMRSLSRQYGRAPDDAAELVRWIDIDLDHVTDANARAHLGEIVRIIRHMPPDQFTWLMREL